MALPRDWEYACFSVDSLSHTPGLVAGARDGLMGAPHSHRTFACTRECVGPQEKKFSRQCREDKPSQVVHGTPAWCGSIPRKRDTIPPSRSVFTRVALYLCQVLPPTEIPPGACTFACTSNFFRIRPEIKQEDPLDLSI